MICRRFVHGQKRTPLCLGVNIGILFYLFTLKHATDYKLQRKKVQAKVEQDGYREVETAEKSFAVQRCYRCCSMFSNRILKSFIVVTFKERYMPINGLLTQRDSMHIV